MASSDSGLTDELVVEITSVPAPEPESDAHDERDDEEPAELVSGS